MENGKKTYRLLKSAELIRKLRQQNKELQKAYNGLNRKKSGFIRKTIELTELKNQLEDKNFELVSKNKEVLNLLKTKTEFINRVAHDLRTPLTPITILIPIIKDRISDEKIRHDLTIVENNAKYLNQLVSELLALIRSQSGKYEYNYEKIKMPDLINEVLENEENVFRNKKIRIKRRISSRNSYVLGNRLSLVEVIQNLISNAIKFMPGGGALTITTFEKDNFIYVSIKDSGIGMAKNTLSKLFDPFFKADKSRHSEGSGLGLSICKKIIENHNGSIMAQSEGLGKGSTLTFYLPIAD